MDAEREVDTYNDVASLEPSDQVAIVNNQSKDAPLGLNLMRYGRVDLLRRFDSVKIDP